MVRMNRFLEIKWIDGYDNVEVTEHKAEEGLDADQPLRQG